MLVLTRSAGQYLLVGDDLRVHIHEVTAGAVGLVIESSGTQHPVVETDDGTRIARRIRSASAAGRTVHAVRLAEREWVRIGDIRVGLCPPRQGHTRIGIQAAPHVRILRGELGARTESLAAAA